MTSRNPSQPKPSRKEYQQCRSQGSSSWGIDALPSTVTTGSMSWPSSTSVFTYLRMAIDGSGWLVVLCWVFGVDSEVRAGIAVAAAPAGPSRKEGSPRNHISKGQNAGDSCENVGSASSSDKVQCQNFSSRRVFPRISTGTMTFIIGVCGEQYWVWAYLSRRSGSDAGLRLRLWCRGGRVGIIVIAAAAEPSREGTRFCTRAGKPH